MLCVLPFCKHDKEQARELALWIEQLGGVQNHECLLVVDRETDANGVIEPLQRAFGKVHLLVPQRFARNVERWEPDTRTGSADAPNAMLRAAAWRIFYKLKQPFLWLEPDAIPLRAGWLDEIEKAYKSCGKPFMGTGSQGGMNGVGVYPWDVCNHAPSILLCQNMPWDIAGKREVVPRMAHTDLIEHVWKWDGQAPTFPTAESLNRISTKTVVFHRCKDLSLIQRLREKQSCLLNTESQSPVQTTSGASDTLATSQNGSGFVVAGLQAGERQSLTETKTDSNDSPNVRAVEKPIIMAKAIEQEPKVPPSCQFSGMSPSGNGTRPGSEYIEGSSPYIPIPPSSLLERRRALLVKARAAKAAKKRAQTA